MSTADEIAKLDALRRSGALTQDEFDAEKATLLATPASFQLQQREPAAPVVAVVPASPRAVLSSEKKAGAWVAVAGGVLLAVSAFLPWFTATAFTLSVSRNGMQLGPNSGFSIAGLVVLLLGLVIMLIAVSRLAVFPLPRWVQHSPVVAGLVAVVVAVTQIPGIDNLVHQVNNASSLDHASIGFGVIVAIVAGLIAAVGGAMLSDRSHADAAPRRDPSDLHTERNLPA